MPMSLLIPVLTPTCRFQGFQPAIAFSSRVGILSYFFNILPILAKSNTRKDKFSARWYLFGHAVYFNTLISFIESWVPIWISRDSNFLSKLSSISSKMFKLVAPEKSLHQSFHLYNFKHCLPITIDWSFALIRQLLLLLFQLLMGEFLKTLLLLLLLRLLMLQSYYLFGYCRRKRGKKLLSACVSVWTELTKIIKLEFLLTRSSHGVFALTDYG